jgi:tRNA(Arg) A34 adenosine deaminase TadA
MKLDTYDIIQNQLHGIGWGDNAVDRIIRAAIRASKTAKHKQHKMGACIVRGRKIIATGKNATRTHTKSKGPFQQVHAETNAIGRAKHQAYGSTLVVVRKKANATLGPSRPCDSCYDAARQAGVRRLIYVDNSGSLVAEDI